MADLKLMAATANGAERVAVDGLLGEPASGWSGGSWDPRTDGHVATSAGFRARRHLLLPALHAVQDEIGWISPGALNYICERLDIPPAEAFGVASFYALLALEPRPRRVAHVCDDVPCRLAGAVDVQRALDAAGIDWESSPCLGRCDAAPAAFFQMAGDTNTAIAPVTATDVASVLEGDEAGGVQPSLPQRSAPELRLLRRIGTVDPEDLDAYQASGGYAALRRALDMGPQAVVDEVDASQLRGRGGAAFPAGTKWRAVAEAPVFPKYVVCNADESETGTFKDRVLLEGDPFTTVESMTIAGFAVGARHGYIYVRAEYPFAEDRIRNAIGAARRGGFLGNDVLGSGWGFDIEIRRGAGAYICGEETALFNSIEGFRGEPRQKPPFPTEAGLFGRPTLVNNVETLANIPLIVTGGGAAFAATGTADSTGTKLFCVSGHVADPGVYEVPFGTTLDELIAVAGGGTEPIAAVLLGGAAGMFVAPGDRDLPLTFAATRQAGLTIGSGAVMVFGESTDFTDVTDRIAHFFRDESCGQCVPCRVGTVRQLEALDRLAAAPTAADADLLRDIGRVMQDASICGLGQTAAGAVLSALDLGLIGERSR